MEKEIVNTMISKEEICPGCGNKIEVGSYRKFVVCKYCGTKFDFKGFEYKQIPVNSSMTANVKYEMDCPNCRSPHMLLGPSGKKVLGIINTRVWKCFDCGYTIKDFEKKTGVFWFCDNCEAYLNTQDGFTGKGKKWKCTECGFENSLGKENIW